ncbi:MAG: general secretion pathway protein GspK [Candidatus Omnitrophica bacterium]|nr:general secretion pathway protein GspK [Candidatus Omnitrophota bacterium]
MPKAKAQGQALVVVVTFLAIFFVVGIAFFTLSQAERAASIRQLDSIRCRYIAEAGIAYAQKILALDREDNLIDSLEDLSFKHFQGDEVDLDGDGEQESRWFNVLDSAGSIFGRFGIRVLDEAAKVNINSCKGETLERLFSQLGISQAKTALVLAQRPLNAIEQAGSILGKEELALAKDFMTIYSRDWEVDLERQRRGYINSLNPQLILEIFLKRGIGAAYEKAALLKDASDTDLAQTLLDKFSLNNLKPSDLLSAGDWRRVGDCYRAPAGGSAGAFAWSNLAVEDGEYFCFLYGEQDSDIVGEVEGQYIASSEGLADKVKVQGGALTLNITPAKEASSRFSHIELVSMYPKNGLQRKIIAATEAIVINELMVKPIREFSIDPIEIGPGDTVKYTFSSPPGNYYLVVLAKNQGGLVGDVSILGRKGDNLKDGDYFPYTVEVKSNGSLKLSINNNSLGNSTFAGIRLLQQPDGEFIELLNLSPDEIDLNNFSFEVYSDAGEVIAGWPAVLKDTVIKPFQHLTFTVDNIDTSPSPVKLRGNGISFKKIWGFEGAALNFETSLNTIDKNFDLLPDNGGRVVLKDAQGNRIDAVEYHSAADSVSLERPDPTARIDLDADGFFDGWYNCEDERKATPNLTNENIGMYTYAGEDLIKHTPNEIKLFNRPLLDASLVMQLSSGGLWKKFSFSDLARMCDSFSYEAKTLDFIGHYLGGEFKEKDELFESIHKEDSGIWQFSNIPRGTYWLKLESINSEGARVRLAYREDIEKEFDNFSTLIFSHGSVYFGEVQLSLGEEGILQLKAINDLERKLILKRAVLEPVAYKPGRINVNTADVKVLRSLLDSGMAEEVLESRPLGNKDQRRLGIGELLLLDSNFFPLQDSLTVKSDVYELQCRGEYSIQAKTPLSVNIRTIVERGE